jgi:beta-aspartyl-peptidase (threonine type)
MRLQPLNLFCMAVLLAARVQAQPCDSTARYSLMIHGGFVEYPEEVVPAQIALLHELLVRGNAQLAAGGTALDAVTEAIAAMEESGVLDAGKGSIVNTEGFTETDASLMDGSSGRSGAVAAMQRLKNPIRAARLVMDKTPHVLIAGTTGEKTLIGLGAQTIDPAQWYHEFVEPRRPKRGAEQKYHGTVGAVALDRCGRLAAGTSTGGYPGKLPGRVGDSPIIGASTFADERLAFSATGRGEAFIKRGATRDIAARVEYLGMPLAQATNYVVQELIGKQDRADGAIIAISRDGEFVVSSNGYGVRFGQVSQDTPPRVATRTP